MSEYSISVTITVNVTDTNNINGQCVDFSNRSKKQHANQIKFKNQQQQQQQQTSTQQAKPTQSPVISSSSSIKSQNPNTSHDTLISVVVQTQSHSQHIQPETPKNTNNAQFPSRTQSHKSEAVSASSGSSTSAQAVGIENISDESQTVNVHTTMKASASFAASTSRTADKVRFLSIAQQDGFATSPRGNLVRTNTEKPYRTASDTRSKPREDYNSKSAESGKVHDNTKPSKFTEQQRKRIQSFVVSDVEPQSFKRPQLETAALLKAAEPAQDVVSSASSSSTTLRYPTTIFLEPRPQPFKYSLQTGATGFLLRAENIPSTAVEETSRPIYERRPQTEPYAPPTTSSTTTSTTTTTTTPAPTTTTARTTTSTTTTKRPVTQIVYVSSNYEEEEIQPTTYAPPLRLWRNGRPNYTKNVIRPESYETPDHYDHVSSSGSEQSIITNTKDETSPRSFTTRQPLTTTVPTTSISPTTITDRPVPTFTARAAVFKDNLIKTTGSPSRFVSPYKSLENILQEKEERVGYNSIRTTAKPRYTSQSTTPPYLHTSSKPFRSYFLITTPSKISEGTLGGNVPIPSNLRNFSVSDAILSTISTVTVRPSTYYTATTTTPRTTSPITTTTEPSTTTESTTLWSTLSTVLSTSPLRIASNEPQPGPKLRGAYGTVNSETPRPRGRSRYTAATVANLLDTDEPTTYSPRFRFPTSSSDSTITPTTISPYRRKAQRARLSAVQNQRNSGHLKSRGEKYQSYKTEAARQEREKSQKSINRKLSENESFDARPRAEALVGFPIDAKQDNSIETVRTRTDPASSTEHIVEITDRPLTYLYSNKYRQQTADRALAQSLQNAGYITSSTGRSKYNPVLEQLQIFLAGESDESSSQQQFVNDFSQREIKAAVEEIKNLYAPTKTTSTTTSTTTTTTTTTPKPPTTTTTTTLRPTTTAAPSTIAISTLRTTTSTTPKPTTTRHPSSISTTLHSQPRFHSTTPGSSFTSSTSSILSSSTSLQYPSSTPTNTVNKPPMPMRASRVNNAIKSSIAAAALASSSSASSSQSAASVSLGRNVNKISGLANNNAAAAAATAAANAAAPNAAATAVRCSDSTSNEKCNEIPSRTNSNSNRNRGSSSYSNQDRDLPATVTNNRGTHPPRTRPTLKPSGTIVSKAQEFVDIYKNPPSRPEPLYPQPTPDKTAAKCRKDVCLLPDCSCGGRDIPGDMPVEDVPQIVILTFDDSVNDLNKQLYIDLFEKGRVNPNGCPIAATFYVSHEWTDYSQVQNLYSEGHEIASHTVSHSFGEQFSQKKWTREVAGQREILAAYGGVKLSDVRGMRAPFLSVGGNKMFKMLHDSNFTYDSSMPVYENRPPSWPYTLDYKIFHDCMIPPCPTRSYPGVWQVPMVMWQDLNGGRCSMGDACSNPSEAEGVTKMIMKNFERHYTTNRAPFGLFYHAAWFTQPHHKEGFIKFLDAINAMPDVWIITNWQMLQWVRDPTPISRINSFQPFQCDFSDRPKRCNNPKVCNLWHKSGVRYMKTCQPCPDIYPWTGKTGIRSSRIDNEIDDTTA